jgi:hypothetical protein
MNARSKLNCAYFNGSVIIAGIIGLLIQSWPIFIVALIVLVVGNVLSGEIRPRSKNRDK